MADESGRGRRRVVIWAVAIGILLGVIGIAATNAMVHWSGSNDFCSNACHSMQWVAEAYRRGPHHANPSGVTAGCADCHIPYHSTEAGALQYVGMLFYKAKAGTRDAIAEFRGVIDTKEKWEKARGAYGEEVKAWMAQNGSLTCRGCHDLTRMGGKAQPAIVEMHAGLAKAGPVNCLDCHQAVGHVYGEVTEDTTDPAKWRANWPKQYDSYLLTAQTTRTRFGGHGGSEALPEEKIARDPWLKRMFLGYAFSIDYRDRRGHAYMLADQEATQRLTKPQTGSCLHCHAAVMPLYRELGQGDAAKGLAESYKFSYQELNKKLHDSGHAHPVTCVDCHDPNTMRLRVTRPGFIQGIQMLASGSAPVPHLPSIERWRAGGKAKPYDPNADATRTEMRSYVCGQCHVEYYCSSQMPLTFPWGQGLRAGDQEKFWNETKFSDGTRFFDYKHAETGAPILKAQHPEFELWSQGVHARAGVACADCHMPSARDGATKVSDHWVRSPLLNINNACRTCHQVPEEEIKARVDVIQSRNFELMQRGGAAITALIDAIVAAKKAGATPEQLQDALELQRKAQWRLDFIAAENSMGFHAPQEAAMVLGEALDYARQGELAATRWRSPVQAAAAAPADAPSPAKDKATKKP